ncbi:uncharacterized protein TNCV_638011 [Trichonephila clavipes]|nr:uncharacterized protein TNCV_638011 [Trichonephila clavipes]
MGIDSGEFSVSAMKLLDRERLMKAIYAFSGHSKKIRKDKRRKRKKEEDNIKKNKVTIAFIWRKLITTHLFHFCSLFHHLKKFGRLSSRKGLATTASAICKYCGSGHTSMTSNTVSDGYEINLRFVYGMRCIGIGKSAAQIFCALMNLHSPPAKFERLYTPIFKALETVSSRSMVKSVNEAVIENEHNKNIAIALDGTW